MVGSFQGEAVFDRGSVRATVFGWIGLVCIVRQAGEHIVQPLEPRLPQRAVLAEPVPQFLDRVGLEAAGAGGAFDAGLDQAGLFQHLEVAADRGLADREGAGEVLHGRLTHRQPGKDGAAGGVGEGGEGLVEVWGYLGEVLSGCEPLDALNRPRLTRQSRCDAQAMAEAGCL